jgi:hypothetical protein
MMRAPTKRERVARQWQQQKGWRATKRTMALATRVAGNKEGDGNSGKSDGNEGGGQAMAMRAMEMAMVMATRVAGNKKGNGKGGKGSGNGNEGGG